MNKKNLELLGLEEGATAEQIEEAYQTLKAKYMEDRFLDGEAGNRAAELLTKIEVAHDELMSELNEATKPDGSGDGESYAKVQELIKAGNLQEAQRLLDKFNERGGEWHYYQSIIFYRKNWINESKKQLEIAMRLDSENEKYKEAYKKLNDKIEYDASAPKDGQGAYQGQDMNYREDNQMGNNFCATCLDCCTTYLCLDCLCNGCCR